MPKRGSSYTDMLPPPKLGATDSPTSGKATTSASPRREKFKMSASKSLPADVTLDSVPRRASKESSPSKKELRTEAGREREQERERERRQRDRSTSRPKSVCVVAPSDSKVLRRAYSEKATTGAGGGGREESRTAVKNKTSVAPLIRHASLSASSRKSMSSLTDDQGSCPEPAQGSERRESNGESSREIHSSQAESCCKSATPSPNGSLSSHTAESVTLRNSSPTLLPDVKKVEEFPAMPSYVSKSKNARFHKLFKSVPLHDYPLNTYSCAFKGDILLQGIMYVSQNWICFHSKIRARGRLLELPLENVISITREKLALIIPNAIGIQMADTKYVFGSFMSRDNTYKLLVTLLKQTQDSASLAGRFPITTIPHSDEAFSADMTPESDTTDYDDDLENNITHGAQRLERAVSELVSSSSSFHSVHSSVSRGAEGGGNNDSGADFPSDKVPGFFSWKCIDFRKMASAFSSFTLKLQKVPRTNLLLVVCSIMVVFLMLSSAGLAYKILLLQARLEMIPLWVSARNYNVRDKSQTYGDSHQATLRHLHAVLKANLQVLEQAQQSLRSLQSCTTTTTSTTTTSTAIPAKESPPDE